MSKKNKYIVKYDGITKTYASLWDTAHHFLKLSKNNTVGGVTHNLQASALFQAFAFEAYLNHVCREELSEWEKYDKYNYKDKLKELGEQMERKFDFGKNPFQTIIKLFSLRDALAHGRTQYLDFTVEVDEVPERYHRINEWEEVTIEVVDAYQKNIRIAIQTINSYRKIPDDEHDLWSPGIRGRKVYSPLDEINSQEGIQDHA